MNFFPTKQEYKNNKKCNTAVKQKADLIILQAFSN